jgi:hypothetical protein
MLLRLLFLSLFVLTAASPAFSEGNEYGPARIKHYAVEKPRTSQDALAVIAKTTQDVAALIAAEKWEAVHEASYTLEAAVQELRDAPEATDARKPALKTLAHSVHELHEASEDHKAEATKKAFAEFAKDAETVSALY